MVLPAMAIKQRGKIFLTICILKSPKKNQAFDGATAQSLRWSFIEADGPAFHQIKFYENE
jgi:hypothetical protein